MTYKFVKSSLKIYIQVSKLATNDFIFFFLSFDKNKWNEENDS